MRKIKLKQKLNYDIIISFINDIIINFLQYINKNKLVFIINEYKINNKKIQEGIIFKVIYKQNYLLSLFFPYDKKSITAINNEYIVNIILKYFFNRLIQFKADDYEQQFIINNIKLLIDKEKDKIQYLIKHKKFFSDKYKDYINSYILLYKL